MAMFAFNPPTTCPSLLRMLALPGMDEAWETFLERYGPLIDARCRSAGLQPADAEDIRATVCASLVDALRRFHHDPARRFRGYFQRTVDNAIKTHWRTLRRRPGWIGRGGDGDEGDGVPESFAGLGAQIDDQVHARMEGFQRAMDRVRFEVGETAWGAFWLTAAEGLSTAEAADRLGKSISAVYMDKSRVLARLRAEAGPPDG
ncbi:RNA polymerase sigma factor [Aquisphaera insulae]|uniref:RNA polymerase sigma factor n=1 Tax=Aquisphaera insulae TaxID=2712864 RepID=UPI0013EA0563|nr:sigma-70 family RNA polymerase sigma factor [Aquisphaera insulae]